MLNGIRDTVEQYLSRLYRCEITDLHRHETVFLPGSTEHEIRILAYSNCTLIQAEQKLIPTIRQFVGGLSRDEVFEMPFVYGQTIHYVPDTFLDAVLPDCLASGEFLMDTQIQKLDAIEDFHNSIEFDEEGRTFAEAAILAHGKDGSVVGAVAATPSPLGYLWEMGVDVLPKYRQSGVATYLVRALTRKMMDRGLVPFYSASTTNIASQMVAARCGFVPAWMDSFGTMGDAKYPFAQLSAGLKLMTGLV